MACCSEDGDFTIIWDIKNFELIKRGPHFHSPPFFSPSLLKTEWYLYFVRQQVADVNHVICCLCRNITDCGPDTVTVRCDVSLVIKGQKFKLLRSQPFGFEKNVSLSFPLFSDKDDYWRQKVQSPSGNTATVRCVIWLCSSVPASTELPVVVDEIVGCSTNPKPITKCNTTTEHLPNELVLNVDKEVKGVRQKLCPQPNHCTAVTVIDVEQRYLEWSLKNISGLEPKENIIQTLGSTVKGAPHFLLDMSVDEEWSPDRSVRIGIRRLHLFMEDPSVKSHVVCSVSLFNRMERKLLGATTDEYLFTGPKDDSIWYISTCIKESDFKSLSEEKLVLLLHFAISNGSVCFSRVTSSNHWSSSSQKLSQNDLNTSVNFFNSV